MVENEIKEEFITFLRERREFFKPVHDGWYKTRCPYCGDTKKSLRDGHFYVKINPEDDFIMGFNCFRCGETGIINDETIDLMGGDEELKQHIQILNKNSRRKNKKLILSEQELLYFDFQYVMPDYTKEYQRRKLEYIENRLGITLGDEDMKSYKIITSLSSFLKENGIHEYPFERGILNMIERNYVGFLSNGNSHIIFRDITEKEKFQSIKYPITQECMRNKIFYTVSGNNLDIFTKDEITINIAEGVMDIIGVSEHFQQKKENTMNIAVTGKYYEIMLSRLIKMGLVGSNITINIYSDNDMMYGNKKNAYTTSYEYYKKTLSKFKPLYKKINIFYNMKAKDFGYPKEKIAEMKKIL